MIRALVLHRDDNVATLIDSGRAGDSCNLQGEGGGQIVLVRDIPFGHKICIRELAAGGRILKYGVPIGVASAAIPAGEHAHTHNIESARGRGDRKES